MRSIRLESIGYPPGYVLFEDGRVVSKMGCTLSTYVAKVGYVAVGLKENGITRVAHLHRLLALAFIPNPENKPHVNHLDGIKTNFMLSNLEWATISENRKHAWSIGLHKQTPAMRAVSRRAAFIAIAKRKKLTADQVVEMRAMRAAGVSTRELGRRFGVDPSGCSRICRGLAYADVAQ